MKKLLFIVVLVAIYAIPASSAIVKMNNPVDSKITIVSDTDEKTTTPEGEKEKDKKKKAVKKTTGCCPAKATVKSGCTEAQQKSCTASKVSCTETKKEKKQKK